MSLLELFVDVDDFCKVFLPIWERLLLGDGTRRRLRKGQLTVSEIMTRDFLMVPPDISVEKLVNEQVLTSARRSFPVVKEGRALEKHAASLIFVHNHPSGDCAPSKSDSELTRDLVFAASVLGLKVLDHIIIGNDKYYSFAAEGLIVQYELDFIGLKMKGVSESKRRD
jgi:CBS domain-containing protein